MVQIKTTKNLMFHFPLHSKRLSRKCPTDVINRKSLNSIKFHHLKKFKLLVLIYWNRVSQHLSLPHTFFIRYVLVDGKSRIYYSSSVWWKQQTGKTTVCTRGRREVASIKSMRYEEGMQISILMSEFARIYFINGCF